MVNAFLYIPTSFSVDLLYTSNILFFNCQPAYATIVTKHNTARKQEI